jgi:hypothetical protein
MKLQEGGRTPEGVQPQCIGANRLGARILATIDGTAATAGERVRKAVTSGMTGGYGFSSRSSRSALKREFEEPWQ